VRLPYPDGQRTQGARAAPAAAVARAYYRSRCLTRPSLRAAIIAAGEKLEKAARATVVPMGELQRHSELQGVFLGIWNKRAIAVPRDITRVRTLSLNAGRSLAFLRDAGASRQPLAYSRCNAARACRRASYLEGVWATRAKGDLPPHGAPRESGPIV
jgi:hypothetical protein